MTEEIVFYHNPRSRAQMVHWMLEEAGAPYRIVPVDFEKSEHKTPSFLALNPKGKLRTIMDRGTVVTETAAIIHLSRRCLPEGRAGAFGQRSVARHLSSLAVLRHRLLRTSPFGHDAEAAAAG